MKGLKTKLSTKLFFKYSHLKSTIFIFIFALIPQESLAVFTQAGSLPKGISRMRSIVAFGNNIHSKFNNAGELDQLFEEKSVQSEILSLVLPEEEQKINSIINELDKIEPNLSKRLLQLDIEAKPSSDIQIYYFVYQYGLTDKLSIGVGVPYIQQKITTNFKATLKNGLEKNVLKSTGKIGREINKQIKPLIQKETQNLEENVIDSLGYQLKKTYRSQGIGDTFLGARYKVFDNKSSSLSTQLNVNLPTSTEKKDFHQLINTTYSDKQYDISFGLNYSMKVTPSTVLGYSGTYTFQLHDTQKRTVPRLTNKLDVANPRDPEQWNSAVHRNLGDFYSQSFTLKQDLFSNWLSISALYNYTHKFSDNYRGSQPEQLNYSALSKNTDQTSHSYDAGLSIDTVQLYQKKTFPIPLMFRLAYVDTFFGKNIERASRIEGDLSLFF